MAVSDISASHLTALISNLALTHILLPAWMLESSHRESVARVLKSTVLGNWIAAIPAAMTITH